MNIVFDHRFVNKKQNDLIPGKIHTIRKNYDFWKKFEGQEVNLVFWQGKPRHRYSRQIIFCKKKIYSVQKVKFIKSNFHFLHSQFFRSPALAMDFRILAPNDGFEWTGADMLQWFNNDRYKSGDYAIIHFTDFQYEGAF